MSQEQFWILYSKKLAGEASNEELAQFEELLSSQPEWQYAVQNLQQVWNNKPSQKDSLEAEDAFMLHLHRLKEEGVYPWHEEAAVIPVSRRSYKKWWFSAAAILAAAGCFYIFSYLNKENDAPALTASNNEITTRKGSRTKVQLPDGTTVLLNAGSRLSFPKEFGKSTREVTLSGEGYFEVTENKDKPFIIHTLLINIKVLGTVFNVKAYPEDKKTETSLIKGSIEVTMNNRPDDKIILTPNEKLVIENNKEDQRNGIVSKPVTTPGKKGPGVNILMSVNKIDHNPVDSSVAEILWTENKLVFRDESFAELAARMERWYDVIIEIQDDRIATERLNGIFQNETITQALDALKESIPFKYNIRDKKIIIQR